MSVSVNVNGKAINYPQTGDTNWGDEATNFAVETSAALSKVGLSTGTTVSIPGTLSVTGTTSLTGNVTATNNLTVNGNTTLGNANTDTTTVTGIVNIDSGTLYVDPVNNRVGVNKTSPAQALDVVGNIAISGSTTLNGQALASDGTVSLPGISFLSDSNTGLFRSGSDQIDIVTGGNSRFRIESTGQIKAVYESQVGTDYNTQLDNGYLCRAWVNFNGQTNNNLSGTYSQSGTTVTVTATSHGYIVGSQVSISITTGTAVTGGYVVTEIIDSNNFRYTAGTSLTTSGNCTLLRNTIRASGNISSISDLGVGDYTVNFTTAMPDVNYAILSSSEQSAGNNPVNVNRNNSRTDTAFRTNICTTQGSTFVDISWVSIGIFR